MARAIDVNELMVEIQVCSWDSEQDKERAEDLVLGMPTLTPPNEPLTLEHLRASPHGKIKDSTLQSICNRANEIACRPPEGEA